MVRTKNSDENLKSWDQNNEDGKLLESLVCNRTVNPSWAPKKVWQSHQEFQRYKLDSFCSALNKLKKKYGVNLRENGDDKDCDDSEVKEMDIDREPTSLFGVLKEKDNTCKFV